MITVINFAEGLPYTKYRKICSKTAKWIGGADNVIEYSKEDIEPGFIEKNRSIMSNPRGFGLWLWKPYFIQKTLKSMKDGDWLFYVDGCTIFINDIQSLVKCAENQKSDILLFEMPLIDHQFTKKECYDALGITDYTQNQLAATYLLVKKTQKTCAFIAEWLQICENESLLSPKKYNTKIKEFSDFVSHREDQSLLTLMRIKYNLPAFRDPSDYGETPHMYFSSNYGYNAKQYPNSSYPTILLSNRRKNPYLYYLRYKVKRVLRTIGLLKPESIIKNKIQQKV